jgi:hypothetical protein
LTITLSLQPKDYASDIKLGYLFSEISLMTSQSVIHPVILCGGSGTRLWPLSRQQFPKQFVPLIQGKSLLRLTAERLKPLLQASVTNPITLLPLLSIAS